MSAGAGTISPETIGGMFGNGENAAEGWGVFLVQNETGGLRVEVQRVDAAGRFPDDLAARRWVAAQVRVNPRIRGVLEQLAGVSMAAYYEILRLVPK